MTVPCFQHTSRPRGKYDAGLALIRNAKDGQFRHEIVGIEEVLQEYRDWKIAQTRRKPDRSKDRQLAAEAFA